MVRINVVTFSLIIISRNVVGEDAMTKNFRFKIVPDVFLDTSSQTTDAPDLLGTFTLNFTLLNDLFKDVQSCARETKSVERFILTKYPFLVKILIRYSSYDLQVQFSLGISVSRNVLATHSKILAGSKKQEIY